jgi:D-serine dehydratase
MPHLQQKAPAVGLQLSGSVTPVHVVWTTGGSMLPEAEFRALLGRTGT